MTARPESYAEFLLSPEWRAVRAQIIAAAGGVCDVCDDPATEVHHYSYVDLTNPGLLVALCHQCHEDADDERAEDPELHLSFAPAVKKWAERHLPNYARHPLTDEDRRYLGRSWLASRYEQQQRHAEWMDSQGQNYCESCERPISHKYRLCFRCNQEAI